MSSWAWGLLGLSALACFIGFALHQGTKVKRPNRHDRFDWHGPPTGGLDDPGSHGGFY
jgi:hypothetical protein